MLLSATRSYRHRLTPRGYGTGYVPRSQEPNSLAVTIACPPSRLSSPIPAALSDIGHGNNEWTFLLGGGGGGVISCRIEARR